MWSTVSALGAAVATSNVGFAGRVKTVKRDAERALRRRRVGARSGRRPTRRGARPSGTRELDRASGNRSSRPRRARRERTSPQLEHAGAGRHRHRPSYRSLPASPAFVGSANSRRVAAFRYGNGFDVGAVLRVNLEVEVVDALGVAGVAVVGDQLPGFDPRTVLQPGVRTPSPRRTCPCCRASP